MMRMTADRVVFRTEGGNFGLCSSGFVKSGDRIAVFHGCNVPVLVRGVSGPSGGCYRIVGETYLSDMMSGEALKMGIPVEWITLE